MSKKTSKAVAAPAPVKQQQPHASHDVRNGKCVTCSRAGADLVPPCTGYRTAAEISGKSMVRK